MPLTKIRTYIQKTKINRSKSKIDYRLSVGDSDGSTIMLALVAFVREHKRFWDSYSGGRSLTFPFRFLEKCHWQAFFLEALHFYRRSGLKVFRYPFPNEISQFLTPFYSKPVPSIPNLFHIGGPVAPCPLGKNAYVRELVTGAYIDWVRAVSSFWDALGQENHGGP